MVGLAREPKGEHSIELTQLASRVDSAMHAEISDDDDPFAKVKVLINDMIARLEEKAFADANSQGYLRPSSSVFTVSHICFHSSTRRTTLKTCTLSLLS